MDDERCTLRLTRRYALGIDEVWRALTAPESVERWLRPPAGVELREVEPGRVLELDWPDASLVRVELSDEAGGTVLVLDHSRIEATRGMRAMRLWTEALDRLEVG
ncbi:MAG: SRPBCC domain-containing protein [Gaiellaceae bacterium]